MSALLFKLERALLEELEGGLASCKDPKAVRMQLLDAPTGTGMQGVGQMKDLVEATIVRLARKKRAKK